MKTSPTSVVARTTIAPEEMPETATPVENGSSPGPAGEAPDSADDVILLKGSYEE